MKSLILVFLLIVSARMSSGIPRRSPKWLPVCKTSNDSCGWGEEPKARLMNILRGGKRTTPKKPVKSAREPQQSWGNPNMRTKEKGERYMDKDMDPYDIFKTTEVRMELLDVRNRNNVKAVYTINVPNLDLEEFMREDTWPAGVRFSLFTDEIKCNEVPVYDYKDN